MSELLCTVEPRNFEILYFRHLFSSFAFPVSPFLATPYSASFSQYTHHLSSVYVHTTYISIASRVFSSGVLLPDLATPNENRNIFNLRPPSPPPVFSSPVQQCWSHCHLVHLPIHSSWYSPVAYHSWHSSPPIPSCLYYFLHFSSTLSITLYS